MEHNHLHELKHHGFTRYDDIETALKKLFAVQLRKLESEEIPISEAAGRILRKDIHARQSLPLYNRSLVDGYALRSIDTRAARRKHPINLSILGQSRLGEVPQMAVSRKECVNVLTGGFLPEGADAVVMFEDVETSKSQISLVNPVKERENLVKAGIDVKQGELLFKSGHILRWFELGLLAALNEGRLLVARRPRVGVLSTGDELSEPGGNGTPDSNRYLLLAALQLCGAETIDLGIARDNLSGTLSSLRRGLKSADMILVSGGSSVGRKDLVPEAISKLGKPGLVVHGIAMRPGSPTGLGAVDGKPILILPGLPISALIGFYVLGQRILSKITGTSEEYLTQSIVNGTLMENVEVPRGMTSYRPVRVEVAENSLRVYPVKPYGSSIASSIVKSDGVIRVGSDVGKISSGEEVRVYLLRPLTQ